MNDVAEVNEAERGESTEEKMDDEFSSELEENYQQCLRDGKKADAGESEKSETEEKEKVTQDKKELEGDEKDNGEEKAEKIKCINEKLEGSEHPETGVPFERRQVEVDGKQYEVVVPHFESEFEAQLPEDKYKISDNLQFKECNAQLKAEVAENEDLRDRFDDVQLEQIEDGKTPEGYTWHHDAEAGRMQLVDLETHQRTAHTGGRAIWGGGTECR